MFVIACKYSSKFNFVVPLVQQVREFHPTEEIVVVDSASEDKSYFDEVRKCGAIVEDINNKHFDVGCYWHAFKKYRGRDFYYFMHDSMKVKANLDAFKEKDLTTLAYFRKPNAGGFISKIKDINEKTQYRWDQNALGVYGPIFFVKESLMERVQQKGFDQILPNNKIECGGLEAGFGVVFEQEGYDLISSSLYGDILWQESPVGKSGPWPHKTDWQFPVEKMYAWRHGRE